MSALTSVTGTPRRGRISTPFSTHPSVEPNDQNGMSSTINTGPMQFNVTDTDKAALLSTLFGSTLPKRVDPPKMTCDLGASVPIPSVTRPDGPSPGSQVDSLLQYLSKQQDIRHEKSTESSAFERSLFTPSSAVSTAPVSTFQERDLRSFVAPIRTGSNSLATESSSFDAIPAADSNNSATVQRLQQQLVQARSTIARHEQELLQTRHIQQTMNDVLGGSSESDFPIHSDTASEAGILNIQNAFVSQNRQANTTPDVWNLASRDTHSTLASDLSRTAGWNPSARSFNTGPGLGPMSSQFRPNDVSHVGPAPAFFGPIGQPLPSSARDFVGNRPQQRLMSDPQAHFNYESRLIPDLPQPSATYMHGQRFNQVGTQDYNPYGVYSLTPQAAALHWGNQQASSRLSPLAPEFNGRTASGSMWHASAPSSPTRSLVGSGEAPNYRRLLDRSVSCNWGYFVDKIIHTNDQQASIFLQQKLKTGSAEQKYEVIEAIIQKAYHLMVNRFGNFLIQRCFEHGTPEQVVAIAETIRGNTLALSMDAFGCHVVQKAFDCVPENYKALFVHELLRRIPETVIHRYACHVWQKLFELRWKETPPQIMKHVNAALRGMWHEVALGETGSLVVQNIFENCLEEEKRPAIEEVLASIDIIAHGQFGNWCIQHICEHGAPGDQSRAIEHILRYATEYSMDQFASKVVEKCLKIGGTEFLDRYLERVCTGRPDRPRMPLIDIASDQYGNYLIQYILTHSSAHHREIVATHIRKHMVSLRGSKFGSRVAMLCSNPSHTTRPSPGVAIPPLQRFSNNGRFGGPY